VEGSDDMEEDTVYHNGDEHGGASTAGLVVISPPATSSNYLLASPPSTRAAATRAVTTCTAATHPITTRAAATRSAAKTSQSTRNPSEKKHAAVSPDPLATGVEPMWFMKALAMLQSLNGGETWTKLLDVWSVFEAQEEYSEVRALDCVYHPLPLSLWMKRHHSSTWQPPVTEMAGFERSFMKWWVYLQPDWRVADGKVLKDIMGDLSVLKRPGLNGFLTVLVGLFYWHVMDETGLEEE